jgi:hypothetical protein
MWLNFFIIFDFFHKFDILSAGIIFLVVTADCDLS